MNVGLVVPGFSADADDWCIPALRHLARRLAERDDVRVIAIRYPYRAARYTLERANVIAVGGAEGRGSATLDIWLRTLDVLRTEHRRRAFDVLHAFWATESGLLTGLAGRVLGIPTLVSLAGGELVAIPRIGYGDQLVAWERLKIRLSLRLADAVSAGSHHLVQLAERRVTGSRLYRAPLGVDLELFSPAALPRSGGPRLLQVGTLTGVKDQAMLLRAFGKVRRRLGDATLDIVGDGPLRAQLERSAGELGIAQAVSFRGAVQHDALPDVYRQSTAFVVSSLHEAQSMVAVEAAACGIPVVGTRVGVIPELAAREAVVPVGGDAALAMALVRACERGPEDLSPARRHAEAEFGLEPCVERFRGLYTRLARGG